MNNNNCIWACFIFIKICVYDLGQGWATLIVTRARIDFSFKPRGQITNPRLHTFYIDLLNLIFIEGNQSIINVICFYSYYSFFNSFGPFFEKSLNIL